MDEKYAALGRLASGLRSMGIDLVYVARHTVMGSARPKRLFGHRPACGQGP